MCGNLFSQIEQSFVAIALLARKMCPSKLLAAWRCLVEGSGKCCYPLGSRLFAICNAPLLKDVLINRLRCSLPVFSDLREAPINLKTWSIHTIQERGTKELDSLTCLAKVSGVKIVPSQYLRRFEVNCLHHREVVFGITRCMKATKPHSSLMLQ